MKPDGKWIAAPMNIHRINWMWGNKAAMATKKLHQGIDKTTFYVTHERGEAMTLASRIVVMHKGGVQKFDEPHAVYNRPASIFVAGFMGSRSMNFIPAEIVMANGTLCASFAGAEGVAVVLVEPTGAETMAVLRVGAKEITGRFDPNDVPRQGEEMILNLDMTRACLFDPATEKLTGAAP